MKYLIIGNCGVGKTYVMRKLIHAHKNKPAKLGTLYFHQLDKFLVLGKYVGDVFDGSDKLSMSVALEFPKLKRLVERDGFGIICEGDRFTNSTFINLFAPQVLLIKGDGAEGRKHRGSTQSERQLRSISTRISNIKPHLVFEASQECLDYLLTQIKGNQ